MQPGIPTHPSSGAEAGLRDSTFVPRTEKGSVGSNIEAFISRAAALLESIASEIGTRCFDLPQNFLLVPVPEDAMPEDWRDAYDEFSDLDPKLAEHARSASSSGAVA